MDISGLICANPGELPLLGSRDIIGFGYTRYVTLFYAGATLSQKQLWVSPHSGLSPVPHSGGAQSNRYDTRRAESASMVLCCLYKFRNELKFAWASFLIHQCKL